MGFHHEVLERRGFDLALMERAGLIIRRENGDGYFDRFRNRIMFPIHDHHGTTVAFSGRTFTGEQPKYMNSPETPLFEKQASLSFPSGPPSHSERREGRPFEGFADVISAVTSGVKESIATMGTSLTEEHAKIIRRNVGEVILCYDSDHAGYEATLKAAEILQKKAATSRWP